MDASEIEKLKEENHILKKVLKNSNIGVWKFNVKNQKVTYSPEWFTMLGYQNKEFPEVFSTFLDILHPDDHSMILKGIEDYINGTIENFDFEIRLKAKNGSWKWIRTHGKTLKKDSQGKVSEMLGIHTDISVYKINEAIIRKKNKKIQNLLEVSPVALVVLDEQMKVIQMNQKFIGLFGYGPDEIKEISDWWPKAYPDKIYREDAIRGWNRGLVEAMNNKSGSSPKEVMIACRDGSIKNILTSVSYMEGQYIVVFPDITELKQAQKQLKEAAEIFEHIQTGIYIYHMEDINDDKSFRMMAANKASEELTGMPIKKIIGKTLDENFPGLREKGIPQVYAKVVHSGKPMAIEDFYYNDKLHVEGAFSIKVFPLPSHRIGVAFDNVTEKKQALLDLEITKLYLDNIINSMPSVIIGTDEKGIITNINSAGEKMFSMVRKEVVGQAFVDVFPRFKKYVKEMKKNVNQNENYEASKITQKIHGKDYIFNFSAFPFQGQNNGAVIRLDDITEKSRLESIVIQSEKMLSIGGLAAGMAHEINNPLGIIVQGIQNTFRRLSVNLKKNREVAEECGTSTEAIKKYLQKRSIDKYLEGIKKAGERAAKIVAHMLSFTRTSDSRKNFEDINHLITLALELAKNDYNAKKNYDFKNIKICLELSSQPLLAQCHKNEIEQVLLNLIKNSAQAMFEFKLIKAKKGKDYVPSIIIRSKKIGTNIVIEVEDNGPGIKEEAQKRIFDPFYT